MRGQILQPHQALSRYIRHYLYCEIGSPGKWTQSSMAPPGYAKLAIVLQADQIRAKENGNRPRNFAPVTFAGQVTHFIPFSWYGELKVFFIIFRPCGAFPLIGIPQEKFLNVPLNFQDVMRPTEQDWHNWAHDQMNPKELKKKLDEFFLLKVFPGSKKQEKRMYQSLRLAQVIKKMRNSYSTKLSVKEVCRQTGYSISTLERRMKKIVGLTPKQLQRIIRYNQVNKFLNQNPSHFNWPRIAQRFGYYDQTHFIKEFKHFNGRTPSKYLEGRRHFLNNIVSNVDSVSLL